MIDQIIYEINLKLEKEFGVPNMIHTVVLEPKNFDRFFYEYVKSNNFSYSTPSNANDFRVCGVSIKAGNQEPYK